jgi:signal transduction histidine kinase
MNLVMTNPSPPSIAKDTDIPQFSPLKILHAARQEATGSKTTAYNTTTFLTGAVFVLISLIVIYFISPQNTLATLIFLSFVFALIFSPIRYGLEELVRQLFPGTDYNSHELIKRLNTISYSTLTRQELSRHFFRQLKAGIDAGKIAFIFLESGNQYHIRANAEYLEMKTITDAEVRQLIYFTQNQHEVISRFSDAASKTITKRLNIKLIVPLTVNGKLTGLLLLGPTTHKHRYTTKDSKVLSAIAPKVGFAIQNSLEYERVSRNNKGLITTLEQTNDKLRRANRQLKHDDKLKDEFVYIATHELKNPVTAMKGYLALIEEGNYGQIPEKLQMPLNQISSSNQQLVTLLNNLLQIARTEAQQLSLQTQPVVICDIINQVTQDLKPLFDQKKLTLDHSCPNTAVTVMADRERLREIINNLVSNAIKYSTEGAITVTHEIVQDKLITHVKDEGVGISKTDQKKIFTRFFRVEEEAAKGIPGTGLGLFLAKQLIEKMGGQISFKSKLGQGSVFSITLPLARTYAFKTHPN